MQTEFRSLNSQFNLNDEDDKRVISGYAVRYNEESRELFDPYRNVRYIEKIAPGAITQDVINRSDVFMTYNHDFSNFLARSRNGKGTLKLELREDGLFFSFEVPDTSFGNDVYVKIKRGELDECSFCFLLSGDEDADYWEEIDGVWYRTINKIAELRDCCVCPVAAYGTTSVIARSLDRFNEIIDNLRSVSENFINKKFTIFNNMNLDDVKEKIERNKQILALCKEEGRSMTEDEEKEFEENLKALEDVKEEPKEEEEPKEDEAKEEQKAENSEEEPKEDEKAEDPKEEEAKEEEKPEDSDEKENKEVSEENKEEENEDKNDNLDKRNLQTTKKHNTSNMEKRFSLVNAISNVVNKRSQDAVSAAVIAEGKRSAQKSGLNYGAADIILPTEQRAAVSSIHVTGEDGTHDAVVGLDFLNILDPLKSKNVLTDLGVNVMTGLINDVRIPYGSSIEAHWAGETSKVNPSEMTFDAITMRPKRLACVALISLQQLAQDSQGIENYVRNQIRQAIQSKIEETVFSNTEAGDNIIGGLLAEGNSTVVEDAIENFAGICNAEAMIEDNDYYGGSIKYAVSPKAKAALRAMQYGGKTTAMVMQGNEVDGTPLISSTIVGKQKQVFVGDWSTVILGSWNNIFIKVDDTTLSDEGLVRLVINTFWDVAYTRPEAIVAANIK